MFGDNESVVHSATIPHAKMKKRNVILSFHRVREAIAKDIMCFIHCRSKNDRADILSEHWRHADTWPMLKLDLFNFNSTDEQE